MASIKTALRRLAESEMGVLTESDGALFYVFDRIASGKGGKYYTAQELIERYGRPVPRFSLLG